MSRRALASMSVVVVVAASVVTGAGRASAADEPFLVADSFKPRVLGRSFTGCNIFGDGCTAVSHESPSSSPNLYSSDRDCGVSVQFDSPARGGSDRWLWLYCDTSIFKRQTGGTYKAVWPYYRTNSAGISQVPAGSSNARRDRVAASMSITDAAGMPYRTFIEPDPDLSCPKPGGGEMAHNAWIQSAVPLPDTTGITLEDGVTPADAAVLITFQTFCSIPGYVYGDTGLALWAWSRTAGSDPHQAYQPAAAYSHGLHARVLTYHLFGSGGDSGFGSGATYSTLGGNLLTTYRCHRSGSPTPGCELARISLTGTWSTDEDRLVDPEQWEYLRAFDWAHFTRPAPGQPGTPPTDAAIVTGTGGDQPADTNSVQYSPALNRWVMIGLTGGFTDRVTLRTATAPWGPWSAGFVFRLPGCGTDGCYAPNLHPELDTATGIGVSYVVTKGQSVQAFDGTTATVQEMRSGTLAASLVPAALRS